MGTGKIHSIKEFTKYLKIGDPKNDDLHIVNFANRKNVLLKSEPVSIDFFLLAIKPPLDSTQNTALRFKDQANSFVYADCPQNSLEWEITEPLSGYAIMFSHKYMNKQADNYNFMHYNNHEALYLDKEEEAIMWDLFGKAYDEFEKENYAKDIIVSYIALILSYIRIYYDRQFDSRYVVYNRIQEQFKEELTVYFRQPGGVTGLPSVAYFAQKANLSANYFGDLIKHFTGESPLEHIHNHILTEAKDKLKNTTLSVSEISYSLGFDYPNYFARFFRKKTGLSPKIFRNN